MRRLLIFTTTVLIIAGLNSCKETGKHKEPFIWNNATIYFMLTDRFYNADSSNDTNFGRTGETAVLRGFMGGDLKGITEKMEEGYFTRLGVNVIWFTPVVEQIRGMVNEGTGDTYAYHGYWTRDWTSLDPNFGTVEELQELIETAHEQNIRVILDVVLNHTGPVTELDPVWPAEWVRTEPTCDFKSYLGSVRCTLVENLPDIRTESNQEVDLPAFLVEKWKEEGRLETEVAELAGFFSQTGLPKAPRFYIMKWLLDFISDYGVDGYRIDTGRHVEEEVWAELNSLVREYFTKWKIEHPDKVLDDNEFFIMGEVYNYGASSMNFDFGDKLVNYYDYGFSSLINFEFRSDVSGSPEAIFSKYSEIIHGSHEGYGIVNYASSHDDDHSFDRMKEQPIEMGTKLLLCPGTVQIYYGDETARLLLYPGAEGDANLRSFMNWEELEGNASRSGYNVGEVLEHWQKLGRFRQDHPSVGAGVHRMLSEEPYIFSRTLRYKGYKDRVVVGLELEPGIKRIDVGDVYKEGTRLKDYYSGQMVRVKDNRIELDTPYNIVLLSDT